MNKNDSLHVFGGFTVLMAVYHRDDKELFDRAVRSVYDNTLQPNAFILVVDGPVPLSLQSKIIDIEREFSIKVFWLGENVGLAKALNYGLQEVKTEWVVRADADDYNLPHRFERQAAIMSQDFDLFGGAIQEVDRDGKKLAIRRTPEDPEKIKQFARYRNPFNHMTVAFRAETARRCGGYPDIHLKEDYGLWGLMIKHGARVTNCPEILVEATAGVDMYKRRGGWRYANAEIELQRHLVECGLKRNLSALALGSARAFVFLLPPLVRRVIYEKLLRKRFASS